TAETAAERLLGFGVRQGFLEEEDIPETVNWKTVPGSGPVSEAPVISERKMYSVLMKQVL
ncbi:MAG: hypothetical protein K2O97_14460, partial [Acetatifactor sp.]|nr:hypothetical protein [Acetatifactor sp.]